MFRFLVTLLLLTIAAALLGIAGGIDVWSAADWQDVGQKWSLPSTADNGRCITLLLGGIFAFLAVVRMLTPTPRKAVFA